MGDQQADTAEAQPDDSLKERHRELSLTVRRAMFTLLAYCAYCLTIVAQTDEAFVLTGGGVTLPVVGATVDIDAFLIAGPIGLVVIASYLHIFWGKILELPSLPAQERTPILFNFDDGPARPLRFLILYGLPPIMMAAFAWKAAVQPQAWLMVAAAIVVTAATVLLWGSRNGWYWAMPAVIALTTSCAILAAYSAPAELLGRPLKLERTQFKEAKLRDVDLRGALLGYTDLSKADLRGANFENAHLESADLRETDLRKAVLSGADLRRADLRGADLSGAELNEADLSGTDLSGANLSEVELYGANLREAVLSGANLRGARLDRADLTRAKLDEANLIGAFLNSAVLSSANLSNADLSRAYLVEANLSGASLVGTILNKADLHSANLSEAFLYAATLSEAYLFVANISEADFSGAKGLTCDQINSTHPRGRRLAIVDEELNCEVRGASEPSRE